MDNYDALASSLGGSDLQTYVKQQAEASGLPTDFVMKLVQQESAFNPSAVSKKGAKGLMQLMPETAKGYGVTDVASPSENVRGGLALLKHLNEKYKGDLRLVAAAYNAGEGAVDKAGGVPNYPETQDYVRRIVGAGPAQQSPTATAVAPVASEVDYDALAKQFGGTNYDGMAKELGGTEQTGPPKVNTADVKKNDNLNKYAAQNPGIWAKIVASAGNMIKSAAAGLPQSLPPPKPMHPVDAVADAAPLVGASVLGAMGAAAGGIGAVPAAFVGGMGGQAVKQLLKGDTSGGASELLKQGAVQGVLQGAGSLGAKMAQPLAARLYQSSLKPAARLVGPIFQGAAVGTAGAALSGQSLSTGAAAGAALGAVTGGIGGKMHPMITKMLDDDIPISATGVSKLENLLQVGDAERRSILAKADITHPGGISPSSVLAKFDKELGPGGQLEKFVNNLNPAEDRAAIEKVRQGFLDSRSVTTQVPGPSRQVASAILGPDGRPVMATVPGAPVNVTSLQNLPIGEANKAVQATYATNAGKYGKITNAAGEAEKTLARVVNQEVDDKAPGLAAVDQATSLRVKGKRALENRVKILANRDPVGFALVAHNPKMFVLALMDRSAAFKSFVARGMWKTAGVLENPRTPDVLRLGILALRQIATGSDDAITNPTTDTSTQGGPK